MYLHCFSDYVINVHGKISINKWKSAITNSPPHHTTIVTIKSLIHGLPQFFLGIYVVLYIYIIFNLKQEHTIHVKHYHLPTQQTLSIILSAKNLNILQVSSDQILQGK